jgi:AcrR family transcriptional regulator
MEVKFLSKAPIATFERHFDQELGLDSDMPRETHPTKAKLIETATALLKSHHVSEISVDMILQESNISKGSMYHHFQDLEELIETALLERYARWVDVSVTTMTQILTSAKSSQEIYAGLVEVTKRTQDRKLSTERFFRAEVLTKANGSPRFAAQLQILQQQLTDSLTDIIREAQERGFYKKDIDPKAIAVFIQAYTLGKIIDDSSTDPVDPDSYSNLINLIIKEVFIQD